MTYYKPKHTYKTILALIKDDKLFCYKQNKLGAFKLPYKEEWAETVNFSTLAEDILKELGVTATFSNGLYYSKENTEVMIYLYVDGELKGDFTSMWLEQKDINKSTLVLEPEEALNEIQRLLDKQCFRIVIDYIDENGQQKTESYEECCSEIKARAMFLNLIQKEMKRKEQIKRQLRLYDYRGNKISQETWH